MVQYQADTRLDIAKIEPWEENNKKIGQLVHWKISCSSMGASGAECISYIKYNKGIDKEKEVIELAESFGIIDKAGAWYSIPFLGEAEGFEEPPKFQGQAKIYDFLVERKDIFDSVKNKVKEVLSDG
jgi:recombination protein RecA